jgi:hypothetical protein
VGSNPAAPTKNKDGPQGPVFFGLHLQLFLIPVNAGAIRHAQYCCRVRFDSNVTSPGLVFLETLPRH